MSEFAYFARQAAGSDANVPAGWNYGWQYPGDANNTPFPTEPLSGGNIPGIPWPPNWPVVPVANLTVLASAPATISLATHAATVEAELRINGLNTGTDAYLNHLLQVTCTEGGAVRKLKKSGGAGYTNAIYFKVSNYAGSKYGFSQTIDFDPANWSVSDAIDIQVKLITVNANPQGDDQWSVVS